MSADTSTRSWSRSRGGICFEVGRSGDEGRRRVTIDQSSEPYLDALSSSEPDGREFGDPLPALELPGSGNRLDTCGEDGPAFLCDTCGEPYRFGLTCRRSRCPRCWQSWAFDRAQTLGAKIESLRAERAQTEESEKFHHLTVSFANLDVRFDSEDALNRAFDATKALLQQVNVHTGYLLYHPWRIAEEYRGEVNGHESGSGDMTWKDVLAKLESDEWSWKAVRAEFLIHAPHFHVVALSDFADTTPVPEIEEQTGVVIHRVTKGPDSAVSMYGVEDLAKVAAYSLSHVGLEEDGDSYRAQYRAFGEVANHVASGLAEKRVDAKLREVSGEILGVDFSTGPCTRVIDDSCGGEHDSSPSPSAARRALAADGGRVPDDDWSTAGSWGSTDRARELWDSHPTAAPEFAERPDEPSGERCGGTLVPMYRANEYLDCEGWVETIDDETLERLRAARDEWEELGKPAPEDVPPPSADSPPPD